MLRPAREFGSRLEYAGLIRSKGALFFHALREALGKSRFPRFLRMYIARFSFRQAGPGDLLRLAKRLVPRKKRPEIEELYRRWLEETHADEDIGLLEPAKLVKFLEVLGELEATAPLDANLLDLLK